MSTSSDLKSGDFFSDQHPPPSPDRVCQYHSPPPPPKQFRGKNVDLSIRDFKWFNTHPIRLSLIYIWVTKKKLSSICLQRTTCIMQENEARNRNTSMRSQMISEFWNIRSLNLSFFWATDPNFLLYGGFWSPVRESGRLPLYPGELAYMKT